MMAQLTVAQMRGVKDLVQTAIDETVRSIEATHNDIARKPYAVLEWFRPITTPAGGVECVQQSISSTVFTSIRAANSLTGACASLVLDVVERHASDH
jgi:hypothetical protein